jgi:hypothetical protein
MPLFPHNGRTFVQPPTLTPTEGGIFQAAEVLPVGVHELMGVYYAAQSTHQLESVNADLATCIEAALAEPEGFNFVESEEPIVVNTAVKCWLSGGTEQEYLDEAGRRVDESSQHSVERWLWEKVFPAKAIDITPEGGAVKPKAGLGIALERVARDYNFVPTVHFGIRLGVSLVGGELVKFDSGEASAVGGAKAVNGGGYFSKTGPGGKVAGANEAWLYVTGQIVLRESDVSTYVADDLKHNTRIAYGLREYIPTIDGPVVAILTTLE